MHADTLYHRMLDQETAINTARKEGRPIPTFAPLLGKPASGRTDDGMDLSSLDSETQKRWKEQLDKLPEHERPAEIEALKAELRAKNEMASAIQGLWQEQAKEREMRKAEGKETVSDKVRSLFGRS
jgi:hypothetical protein